jgi:nucleoid-associated protein YgaU
MDRYLNQRTVSMPHSNGTQVTVVLRKPYFPSRQRFMTYTATAADHMWTLADRFYKNPFDWWTIADMNPHIECPDDLRYGAQILLPVT